jgi:putative hydrolase of the HAD superfamily
LAERDLLSHDAGPVRELLADYTDRDHLHARLLEAERRNLGHYGFGIKGFMLSMIETAIEVTEGACPPRHRRDPRAGQEMLAHPIELLPEAEDTVRRLRKATRWS